MNEVKSHLGVGNRDIKVVNWEVSHGFQNWVNQILLVKTCTKVRFTIIQKGATDVAFHKLQYMINNNITTRLF